MVRYVRVIYVIKQTILCTILFYINHVPTELANLDRLWSQFVQLTESIIFFFMTINLF